MLIPLTPVVKVLGILVSIEQTLFYSRGKREKEECRGRDSNPHRGSPPRDLKSLTPFLYLFEFTLVSILVLFLGDSSGTIRLIMGSNPVSPTICFQ